MSEDLTGRVALVTGGSRGIGRGTVEALAEEGMRVVFTYRQLSSRRFAQDISRRYPHAESFLVDVTSQSDATALVEHVAQAYDTIDVLVNNAGIAEVMWPNDRNYTEAKRRSEAVNCDGTRFYTEELLRYMHRVGHGDIIFMSSIAATLAKQMAGAPADQLPPFSMSPYVETKLWTEEYAARIAEELKGTGIRSRVLHPELVVTDMGLYLAEEFAKMASEKTGQKITSEQMAVQMADMTPSKRMWEPEEIGQQVVHLLKHPELKTIEQARWASGAYKS